MLILSHSHDALVNDETVVNSFVAHFFNLERKKKFPRSSSNMKSSIGEAGSIDDMLHAIKSILDPQGALLSHEPAQVHARSRHVEMDSSSYFLNRLSFDKKRSPMMEFPDEASASLEAEIHDDPHVGYQCRTPWWEQQAPYNTMTLPEVFKLLEGVENDRIICVKKIHKLGFKSVKFLRQYFSQYGVVKRVVVLPSRQKEVETYDGSVRYSVRPASMCFVVMANASQCEEILMHEYHCVGYDCLVEVSVFNRGGAGSTSPTALSLSISSRSSSVATVSY